MSRHINGLQLSKELTAGSPLHALLDAADPHSLHEDTRIPAADPFGHSWSSRSSDYAPELRHGHHSGGG
jgi:hypothetical protein